MRKIKILIVSFILVMACAMPALADNTISVSGTGEALVPADTAIINLGVSARNIDVLQAQAEVNEKIEAIRAALLESGIAREDINTGYINIYAIYDYGEEMETLTAYNASSTLAIRTEDMENVGGIIDTAFEAGANTLNGITFSATDTDEAEKEALKKAVADARGKADVLAEAAGLKIAGIESIIEGGTYSYDGGLENNFALKTEETADAAGTFVQSAKLTVTASITITYDVEE